MHDSRAREKLSHDSSLLQDTLSGFHPPVVGAVRQPVAFYLNSDGTIQATGSVSDLAPANFSLSLELEHFVRQIQRHNGSLCRVAVPWLRGVSPTKGCTT